MSDKIKKMMEQMLPTALQVKMHLQGNSDVLALIRRIVAACVKHLELSPSVLNDIKLATTEACTNVIKHAYKFDEKKAFDLHITSDEELFVVDVFYFDPDFVPENIPVPNLQEIKEGGLGVFIIRNIMDYVDYQTDSETCKVRLKMVKLLKSQQ